VAFGYSGILYDDIEATNIVGDRIGTFESQDQQFLLGYGFGRNKWHAGLTGRYFLSEISDSSVGAASADLGVSFPNPFWRRFSHALTIQNLGQSLDYQNQSFDLPLQAKLGTKMGILGNWNSLHLALDVIVPKEDDINLAVGAEMTSTLLRRKVLAAFRVGYTTRTGDIGNLSGIGLGGGITRSNLTLDFAWVPHDELGESFVLTFSYRLNNKIEEVDDTDEWLNSGFLNERYR